MERFTGVYGVRQNRKESWLLRCAYAAFYRLLKSMANIDLPLDAGDFSLMDRQVVDRINARAANITDSYVGCARLGRIPPNWAGL